ncbi:prosaposin-like [Mustelus asterias]
MQSALEAVLHKGCHLIPVKEVADQCDHYIDSYLAIVFALLEKGMKPDVVCAALGLCKHQRVPLSNAIPVVHEIPLYNASLEQELGPLSRDGFVCNLCQFIMKKLKISMSKKQPENFAVQPPSKICSGLPNAYFAQCHNLMEQKGDIALDLLFKGFTTNAVCYILHVCSTRKRDSVLPIMECDMCENLMQQLQSARTEGTGVDILLSGACNPYSDISKLVCEDFIRSNKPTLNTLLQDQEERDLCGELDLCAREVKAQLLGNDECTWGPSHWCTDRETAIKCQAVKYCEENGWI